MPGRAVWMLLLLLSACSSTPHGPPQRLDTALPRSEWSEKGNDVTLFALSLLDTGYRFGGKNPEAGLDCSGMVSYIYNTVVGLKLTGSAAEIARRGRPLERELLRPGDLVFFNTRNAPFSHVGVYIGDDRFVHAPSSNGRVRIDSMKTGYFAQRYQAARSYFD